MGQRKLLLVADEENLFVGKRVKCSDGIASYTSALPGGLKGPGTAVCQEWSRSESSGASQFMTVAKSLICASA